MDTYRRVYPQPPIDLSPRADRQPARAIASAEAPVTVATNRCHTCDRPVATVEQWAAPHNEPACDDACYCRGVCWGDCRHVAVDWRARCLAAERVIDAVRACYGGTGSADAALGRIAEYDAARGKP